MNVMAFVRCKYVVYYQRSANHRLYYFSIKQFNISGYCGIIYLGDENGFQI